MTVSMLVKENRIFFTGFFLFVLFALFVLIGYSKAAGFYILNPYHSRFWDQLFIYYTNAGDGFFCVAIGLLLFLFRKRFLGLMVLVTYAISGIIAQVLKHFVREARPAVLLKGEPYRYFIENVTLHNYQAFPSGHSASAFAMAAVLSFAVTDKRYSLLFMAAAILVGYSRIYLGQHFMDDVFVGSILGVVTSIACWLSFSDAFHRLLRKRKPARS